jgi:SAM-dependent methyltransferase
MPTLVEQLVQEHLGGSLPPDFIELTRSIDDEHEEVQDFVRRYFRTMGLAGFRPQDFSWPMAFQLARSLGGLRPGAWGGVPPPVTQAGRNQRFDDYVANNPWWSPRPGASFLDVGCGFPPVTTLDTATRFPELQVTGMDPAFGLYLVYDEAGDYACFDRDSSLRFCYAGNSQAARTAKLYRDLEATRARFAALRERLALLLPAGDEPAEVEEGSCRIIREPIAAYETDQVHFFEGAIGSASVISADFVRCASVLMYFDRAWRDEARRWLGQLLRPGGVLLHGGSSPVQRSQQYFVWRREGARLVPKEFAISPSNLRPVADLPFVSWAEDSDEWSLACALLTPIWTSDTRFRADFDAAHDALLIELDYCRRRLDGFLGPPPESQTPQKAQAALAELDDRIDRDGWVQRAAEVFRRSTGKNAWRNSIGHLAVDPLEWGWGQIDL